MITEEESRRPNLAQSGNLSRKYFWQNSTIGDYAKDGGLGEVWILCSFYHVPLRIWIKTNVNKFATSSHMALKLRKQLWKLFKDNVWISAS